MATVENRRLRVTGDLRAVITHLALLREIHNALYPDTKINQADIAAYIGVRSKSTVLNYEKGDSVPTVPVLSKWLEFWGEGLFIGPLEDK